MKNDLKPCKCVEHICGQCHGAYGDEYIQGCKGYDMKCVIYKSRRHDANDKGR